MSKILIFVRKLAFHISFIKKLHNKSNKTLIKTGAKICLFGSFPHDVDIRVTWMQTQDNNSY